NNENIRIATPDEAPDSDGDGVPDHEDDTPDDATVATPSSATGTGQVKMGVAGSSGAKLSAVKPVADTDQEVVQDNKPADVEFPDGLVQFEVADIVQGETVQITMGWPTPFKPGAKYYKVDDQGFHEYPHAEFDYIANTVTLTLTDGGDGDGDGTVNGVIDDPGAVGAPTVEASAVAEIAPNRVAPGATAQEFIVHYTSTGELSVIYVTFPSGAGWSTPSVGSVSFGETELTTGYTVNRDAGYFDISFSPVAPAEIPVSVVFTCDTPANVQDPAEILAEFEGSDSVKHEAASGDVTGDGKGSLKMEVAATADLDLAKSVDNASPTVDDEITFTLTLLNNGPDQATGVTVTDSLPTGLTYASDNSSGSYDSSSGIWTVGTLAASASATLNITATADSEGDITNAAAITASGAKDPDLSNNTASATVTPTAAAPAAKGVAELVPNTIGAGLTAQTFSLFFKPNLAIDDNLDQISLGIPTSQPGWGALIVTAYKLNGIPYTVGTDYSLQAPKNAEFLITMLTSSLTAEDNGSVFEVQFTANTPATAQSAATCQVDFGDATGYYSLVAGDADPTNGQGSLDIEVTAAPSTGSGSISGTVINAATENPIVGATVELWVDGLNDTWDGADGDDHPVGKVQTFTGGLYVFDQLPDGAFHVVAFTDTLDEK
ncbi:MAG: DUF11 domain-containing protein, partial [bacterium]|nr:DUF11 domain-containing protein [bacterium]